MPGKVIFMGAIKLLDQNMVNMIAAGEVIERPASVVKELMENSLDAGAAKITVTVEDGGKKLIRISDDGAGMDARDLELAFEPHATSKISTSDDLLAISTMGFRGEALASIASVSKVKVTTRPKDSIEAHRIVIDCGIRGAVEPRSADYGTTIEVRDLFYKLPGRRKFLRTANTEMSHITETFTRIALANNGIDLTLNHNGREVYRIVSGQSVRERIGVLKNTQTAEDMIETGKDEKDMSVYALLGRPASAKSTANFQYVFLNGRFIRDRFVLHAVKEGYRGLIEPGRYPVVFLFIKMDPALYDVNVHPTKTEVRFDNPNLVHSQVLAVIREKLLGMNLDISGEIPSASGRRIEEIPPSQDHAKRRERIESAMRDFFGKQGGGGQKQMDFGGKGGYSAGYAKPQKASEPFSIPQSRACEPSRHFRPAEDTGGEYGTFVQIHNSYIVQETAQGFVIIDQHALHERIIYEKLREKFTEGTLESQRLLIPESFEATDQQIESAQRHAELIEKMGIELTRFGPKELAVQAFPTILQKAPAAGFVSDMLDMLGGSEDTDREELLSEILDMAACKAAVKAGQKLSGQEITELLEAKENVLRSSRCPHGRPTTITFTKEQLEKQFKRT